MIKLSKKRNFILKNIKFKKNYNLIESLVFLKKYSIFNFIESIDISLKLCRDFFKNNNFIKDIFFLPYNNYKFKKLFVYVSGDELNFAKNMGILNVGFLNFNISFNKSNFNFDLILTNKYYYNYIKFFYKFLSFKKIFPSYLNFTLVDNIRKGIYNLKLGSFSFKSDKNGIINFSIGKVNYSLKFLFLNFLEFLKILNNKKPNYIKNKFFSKIFISSTMGFSFNLSLKDIYLYI